MSIKQPWLGKAEMESDQTGTYYNQMTIAYQLVDNAHRKFEVAADVQRRCRLGLPVYEFDSYPFWYSPNIVIQLAVEAIMRLSALYTGFGHVFAFCGERVVGLQGDAQRWQAWEGQRAELAARVDMALRRLCSATAHTQAAVDTTRMAVSFPLGSRNWTAWVSTTEQHLRRALDDAAVARDALQQLPIVVVRDFSEAWELLSP